MPKLETKLVGFSILSVTSRDPPYPFTYTDVASVNTYVAQVNFPLTGPQVTMVMDSMLSSSLLPVIYPEAAFPTTLISWNTCLGEMENLDGPQGGY
jgi:hypothetical protein